MIFFVSASGLWYFNFTGAPTVAVTSGRSVSDSFGNRDRRGHTFSVPQSPTGITGAPVAAIAEVRDWFENRTEEQQVFRLFGYAGSGKSTVLKFALDDLGLSPHRSARDGSCVPGVR